MQAYEDLQNCNDEGKECVTISLPDDISIYATDLPSLATLTCRLTGQEWQLSDCLHSRMKDFRNAERLHIQEHVRKHSDGRFPHTAISPLANMSLDLRDAGLFEAYQQAGAQYRFHSLHQPSSAIHTIFPFEPQLVGCITQSDWDLQQSAGNRCVTQRGTQVGKSACPVLQVPLDRSIWRGHSVTA